MTWGVCLESLASQRTGHVLRRDVTCTHGALSLSCLPAMGACFGARVQACLCSGLGGHPLGGDWRCENRDSGSAGESGMTLL